MTRVAAAAPDCEIAVDHCGFVSVGGADRVLADLAKCDNLVVKLSTGVFDAAAVAPRPVISRLLDLFGSERIVWGSDHPQVHDRTYPELAALVVITAVGYGYTRPDGVLVTPITALGH